MSRFINHASVDAPTSRTDANPAAGIQGLVDCLALLSALALAWQALRPEPVDVAGLRIDRVTALFGLLVAGIGAVTLRYAMRALAGDPSRGRFALLMALAIGSAWVTAAADWMPLMVGAFVVQGFALHGLLTVRHDRPQAVLPARTAFLAGRLGDLFLVAAFSLAWRDSGALSVSGFLQASAAPGMGTAQAIAVLAALSSIAKSAQVPFHSWLPETMEAPTPVSALMHAGIVNAGGVLLVRFAPVIAESPAACALLVLAGTLTVAAGMPAMWAQVKVKRELAWSTVAQMGFMTLQCGLAAFPAAAMHVVGHGCYKAWSFLRAGDVPARPGGPASVGRGLVLLAAGTAAAFPAIVAIGAAVGMHVLGSPAECAMSAVLALSVGQAWAAINGRPAAAGRRMGRVMTSAATLAAAAIIGPVAWTGMAAFLEPVIGRPSIGTGPLAWTLAAMPFGVIATLAVLHAMLPTLDRRPWGFALHVHALNGFYLGTAADRLVETVWPSARRTPSAHTHG